MGGREGPVPLHGAFAEMSIHGIEQHYVVIFRRGRWHPVAPEWEQLSGRIFRFKPGFTIRNELGGYYAGELAMIALEDPEHPYPENVPIWLPSGDLRPVSEGAGDLVEQAA